VLLATLVLLAAAKQPVPAAAQLYAWANPLIGPLADHTWVTDYDKTPRCPAPPSAYWYSTGSCHPSGADNPPRPLARASANLAVAHCIATPDKSTFQPGPATALIVYGVDGVCHQICNRVLAATATAQRSQVTVAKANGYRISRFVYGTHGTASQWRTLQAQCKPVHPLTFTPDEELSAMIGDAFGANLATAKQTALQTEHAALQGHVQALANDVMSGRIATGRQFANSVNEEVNKSLRRLAENLGKDDFEKFFEWPAGREIILVNPEIAAEVHYRR
jgi:hypothetical protein